MNEINRKNLFTIGEMVRACRTTKDTLYFYERKGLIKPAFTDTNGYRYYDLQNFYQMDMIAALRASGSSVKEIQNFMVNVKPESYIDYMKTKKEYFKTKRREYQLLEEKLQRSIEVTEQGFHLMEDAPQIEYEQKEYLILVKCADYHNDHEAINAFSLTRKICDEYNIPDDIHQSAMISQERLLSGGENRFENDYYYATSYEPISGEYVHIKPEGLYVSFVHKGAYTRISASYENALAYIKRHNFVIDGNSYEKTIVGWFNCNDSNEYITKVSIKIGEQ